MLKIAKLREIDKKITEKIFAVEKRIKKDLRVTELNKAVLKKINDEVSILGKEKLAIQQIIHLSKSKKSKNKEIKERIRKQSLYFLIELYKFNHKMHDILISELRADGKLLKKRIENKMRMQHVYETLFNKFKDLGKRLTQLGYMHMRNYNLATSNKKAHLKLARITLKKLLMVKEILSDEKHIMRFRKILLIKSIKVFHEVLELVNKNAKLLTKDISLLEKKKSDKELNKILLNINQQIEMLHSFAIKFNDYIIHSEPFYVGKEKHIIITHDVKPVF